MDTKPAKIDLGDVDEGLQTFTFGQKEITIDVFDVLTKLQEIRKKLDDEGKPRSCELDEIVKLLTAEGLEKVTKVAAVKFLKYINELAEYLKKNIESSVSSATPIKD